MSYKPWFPDPGSYIRHFDHTRKEYVYKRLLWRRDPLVYPRRLPVVAADSKGDSITFDEINPSATKNHIYLAYLGVRPGFLYYLWHPYDVKNLKWDEDVQDISEDLTARIDAELSPYEYPTKAIGIENDRYPAIQALNVSGVSKNPEVIWVAALYVVKSSLPQDELIQLQAGRLKSYPWDFGGEL